MEMKIHTNTRRRRRTANVRGAANFRGGWKLSAQMKMKTNENRRRLPKQIAVYPYTHFFYKNIKAQIL